MKALRIINIGVFSITIALYITIFYGLYSQIILGIVQLVSSIILALNFSKLTPINQTKLKRYWCFVSVYFMGWLLPWERILSNNIEGALFVIGIIIIPLVLAVYFLLIVTSTKLLNNGIK